MAKSATLSDITFPSTLASGETGHVKGYATNTGTEEIYLRVELFDADTGTSIARTGSVRTIPQAPVFNWDLAFVMPDRDFRFEVRLHD